MTRAKNSTLPFALVVGATTVVLLFCLSLKAVAESSDQADPAPPGKLNAAVLSPDVAAEELRADAYTTYLPLIGLNMGAPPHPFGIQMYGAVTYTTGLNEVAAAGATWVRVPILWETAEAVNSTPDEYDWTAIDAQVQALSGEGIEPLLILGGNPVWAADYPMGPVQNVADLQEFVGALVERFDGDGVQDAPGSPVVRYLEIYNEPDNADEGHAAAGGYGYWGERGDEYAAMLDALYPVVKAANPKTQVVFGGIAHDNFDFEGGGFDPDFIDDVLANCTGPCFDVMNFHYFPYYRFRWEAYGKDVLGKTNFLRAKLASHGFDRPLMCTETTWPLASTWGSDVLQPRYVVAGYVRGMAADLVVLNWYAWRDVDSSLPGLLDNTYQPKPAYFAYQTLTEQLGKAQYVRPLTQGETGGGNIEGYVFNLNGPGGVERLDVVWVDCPAYQELPPQDCDPGTSQTMAVATSALLITDLYGGSRVQYDADDGVVDGYVRLGIGLNPVFLKHVEAGSSLPSSHASRITHHASPAYANCRFGVGSGGSVNSYDVAALNLGWYVDWQARQSAQPPAGVEYVQTVRLKQVGGSGWAFVSPRASELTATVQANPSSLWFIGNEPDSPFQDDMVPEAYAHGYHDVYHWIKALDPTAQVGIAGIVQPTALRLEYLDVVWESYLQTYGERMPVDVWNIHTFILREATVPPDPEPCGPHTIPVWGAYFPPGISGQSGQLYCLRDQDDVELFAQRIRAFRQWMADKGERDKPLIVTEYGILFPEDYSDEDGARFDRERVSDFMVASFDFFLNETDPETGYSRDSDRLVQRWAWFSLNADPYDWGGTLFDPDTHALLPLGEDFAAYTSMLPPSVDPVAARAFAEPSAVFYEGVPVAAQLKAVVSNAGNVAATGPITVTFYDGPLGQGGLSIIGEPQVIAGGLQGCADSAFVSVTWEGLDVGVHPFSIVVEAADADADPGNNAAEGIFLLASHGTFLPMVVRD
jgi:hypothetical protein